jgi:hypothetical protein
MFLVISTTIIITLLITIAAMYLLSNGKLFTIFFSDINYKCGMVKHLQKQNDNSNLDVTSLYPTQYDAGALLKGCGQPQEFKHGIHHCTYNPSTTKYECKQRDPQDFEKMTKSTP